MANSLEILITAKDQFSPKAQKAQRSARNLKGGMASLGKTVLGVGAGFIAAQASIAGVSKLFSSTIGSAMKFEAQLAQIRALTGATTKDTDFLSVAIKDMAREMPKSPEELGSAAYFILSSGIEDAAEAADVLNVAAKASTIGLGETEKVADALTTVLNAYGLEASEAGHVTDVMIEAVKQGKAEASAFAGVLGRVVPLASQMGISFEEVSANLATFTRLGVSAQEAATGLRAVMNALINPTDQTRATMEELGLSVEGLRKQIKEQGLLAALDSMMTATGGNEEALAKLFPNIRALTSVLGTAGVQLEDYKDILAATENATGNLDEGFGIVSDTAQFKMQTAISQLNVLMLELGEDILPALVPAVEGVVFAFQTLGEAMAPLIITIGLIGSAFDGLATKEDLAIQKLQGMAANAEITEDEFVKLAKGVGLTATAAKKLAADTSFPTQMEVWRERAVAFGMAGEEFDRQWEEAGVGFGMTAGGIQTETDQMKQRAQDLAAEMESNVGPTVTGVLFNIEESAGRAEDAMLGLFNVTTQEEADAEAAIAAYRFELGQLEAASEGAAEVEGSRAAELKNDLIPAEQGLLDLLRLENDAVEKGAAAMALSLPTLDQRNESILRSAQYFERLNRALSTTTNFRGFEITVGQAALFQGRQHGGPVSAGQAVLVGEKRPEIFVPDRAGTILPNVGMGGGGDLHVHIHADTLIGGDDAARELARMVAPEIRRMMR